MANNHFIIKNCSYEWDGQNKLTLQSPIGDVELKVIAVINKYNFLISATGIDKPVEYIFDHGAQNQQVDFTLKDGYNGVTDIKNDPDCQIENITYNDFTHSGKTYVLTFSQSDKATNKHNDTITVPAVVCSEYLHDLKLGTDPLVRFPLKIVDFLDDGSEKELTKDGFPSFAKSVSSETLCVTNKYPHSRVVYDDVEVVNGVTACLSWNQDLSSPFKRYEHTKGFGSGSHVGYADLSDINGTEDLGRVSNDTNAIYIGGSAVADEYILKYSANQTGSSASNKCLDFEVFSNAAIGTPDPSNERFGDKDPNQKTLNWYPENATGFFTIRFHATTLSDGHKYFPPSTMEGINFISSAKCRIMDASYDDKDPSKPYFDVLISLDEDITDQSELAFTLTTREGYAINYGESSGAKFIDQATQKSKPKQIFTDEPLVLEIKPEKIGYHIESPDPIKQGM